MTKQEEKSESYELEWLKAERDLAILEYENAKWLDKKCEENDKE